MKTRKGYYKTHLRGKPGLTLCGKPVQFAAGMCADRSHRLTVEPDEVTCRGCITVRGALNRVDRLKGETDG